MGVRGGFVTRIGVDGVGVDGWSQVGMSSMGGRFSHPDVEVGKNMHGRDTSQVWIICKVFL